MSSFTIALSINSKTGASFIGATTIETTPGTDVQPLSSETVNVKLSLPLKFSFGVYTTDGKSPDKIPYTGFEVRVYVIGSLLGSVPTTVIATESSSSVEIV